ncbi:unnamed protein product, partial [Meganyctiphanes norvegica]
GGIKCKQKKRCTSAGGLCVRKHSTCLKGGGTLLNNIRCKGKKCVCCKPPGPSGCPSGDQEIAGYQYITYDESNPNKNCRGNPERGLYLYTETFSSSWEALDLGWLQDQVQKGYTLFYRVFVLDLFKSSDISNDVLQLIKEDFITAQEARIK